MNRDQFITDHDRLPRAPDILDAARDAMRQRAEQRDHPTGERSMPRAIAMFNAMRAPQDRPGERLPPSPELTERDGWLLMALLKISRAQGGKHTLDDYVDMAAYCALAGEAAEREADLPF